MITRRRGHCHPELKSREVEVCSAVKAIEDLPNLPEEFPADDFDSAGIELDDLFGIESLKWTLERDATSPIFDVELGEYSTQNRDSGAEDSTACSPENMSSALKIRNKQMQSFAVGNKNAIAARLNRLKKKEYINSLEKKVGMMSTENNTLKVENSQLTKRVEELEDETRAPTQTSTTTRSQGNV
ncbi:CREB/ATF bZIP transcription factor [Entelurus aequoreus]|uniref:CREB/ATF bZIP transcription factor n=1 Tax=Entelurus aequoreus TaxID=161455 RepID=UPI002B1E8E5E|nr:CREB/ATF bZIP transcription factor [Entelurus aequoreus]